MVSKDETVGAYLRRLIQRAGMTQTEVARAMGYRGASSIQRFLDTEYGRGEVMKLELATKFAKAVVGKGDPPITSAEVFWLSGVELTDRGTFKAIDFGGTVELGNREFPAEIAEEAGLETTGRDIFKLPRTLPGYAATIGGYAGITTIDGKDIVLEQTAIRSAEIIAMYRRPPPLRESEKAYVQYVQGSSMEPKFEEGEAILIDPRRPIRARDYVMVTIAHEVDAGEGPEVIFGFVRRLVRRTADYVELEQFNPPAVFRLPVREVTGIAPVTPWSEALEF